MRGATALALLIGATPAAFAGAGFDLVIPGRPGVPVIIDGIDASYAVVEGNFGLGKGVRIGPTIYGGRPVEPMTNVGHYYPTLGLGPPGYGRSEIEPPANRKLPQPAESYHRTWSSQPALPPDVPENPPPIIVAPQIDLQRNGR
jgi:hypothetical protein